jgi:hypothetical protein
MLGSKAFLSTRLVYKVFAYLPTATNKLLDKYSRDFEEFNLQTVKLSREVSLAAKCTSFFG